MSGKEKEWERERRKEKERDKNRKRKKEQKPKWKSAHIARRDVHREKEIKYTIFKYACSIAAAAASVEYGTASKCVNISICIYMERVWEHGTQKSVQNRKSKTDKIPSEKKIYLLYICMTLCFFISVYTSIYLYTIREHIESDSAHCSTTFACKMRV